MYNRPMLILWIVAAAITLLTIPLGNRHWAALFMTPWCAANAIYCWRRLSSAPPRS